MSGFAQVLRLAVFYREGEASDMQPSEQFVLPKKDEKDKYEKKEIDQNIPDKPREPGEAIPDKGEAPEHEGATEEETGDRTGPGAGFDDEPEKVKDKGGVAPS